MSEVRASRSILLDGPDPSCGRGSDQILQVRQMQSHVARVFLSFIYNRLFQMSMSSEEKKRRNPAFERTISTISNEDIRVRVIGTVIEKDQVTNSIVIDDGAAKVRVLLDEDVFTRYDVGKRVRVIGVVAPALEGEGFELKGEIVQDWSGLDLSLWHRYLELKKV